MCFIMVPLMALSLYMILKSGAGSDGILGKEAYEAAANVADEALSSMTTVTSFVGETKVAARYEANLKQAEDAAIRQVSPFYGGRCLFWQFHLSKGGGIKITMMHACFCWQSF